MSPRPSADPAICLATADFTGLVRTSGIATYSGLMSRLLAERGWRVHVLFVGPSVDAEAVSAVSARLAGQGIGFTWLDEQPLPPWAKCEQYGVEMPRLSESQRMFERLELLQAEHRFDMIEFPDWQALGLRSIQAKRTGAGLHDVALAVTLHSGTRWLWEGDLGVRRSPLQLKVEWCERYAFENADLQLSPSRCMIDYTREIGWKVRDDVAVNAPFPESEPWSIGQADSIQEVVFFGRLEVGKGLDLFLEALAGVDPNVPVLFMGKSMEINGRPATERIAERIGSRSCRVETELERDAALAKLRGGNRLAVIASTRDNFPFTVSECIANRIPFLAARTGGIPEILPHTEAQRRWLFPPTASGLSEALARRLAASEIEERALADEVAELCHPGRWNDRVEALYRSLLERRARPSPRRRPVPATVSVAVTHRNKAPFLAAALRSLAEQTFPPNEVIVVDDGSTDAEALAMFKEQEAQYPEWTFIRQRNVGLGATINVCLALATSTYFLPFDADNIATPDLVETMLTAMKRGTSLDAVSCHLLAFVEDEDIACERFAFRFSPTGGPLLLSLLQNVYGDTGTMFRAATLRAVGGWETERSSPTLDWQTLVKLSLNGHRVEVIPRALYYYRTNTDGMGERLSNRHTTLRQRAHMIDTLLADAPLTRQERIELWECLAGFEWAAHVGIEDSVRRLREEIADVVAWRERDLSAMREWHEKLMEELRVQLTDVAEPTPEAILQATVHALRERFLGWVKRLAGRKRRH